MIGERIRSNRGFALVELLTGIFILSMGLAASFQVFTGSNHTNLQAQRNEIAISLAQREMEKIKSLKYSEVALSGAPSVCAAGSGQPCGKVSWLSADWNNCPEFKHAAGFNEFIVGKNASGVNCWSPPGAVRPGPDPLPVKAGGQTVNMQVWRYVTLRDEKCPSSAPCGDGTLSSIADTKRVMVAVVPDRGVNANGLNPKPVWLSSVMVDPNAAPKDIGKSDTPVQKTTTRTYYLTDKLCGGTDTYTPPTGPHPTHDTTAVGSLAATSKCTNAGSNRPDLMSQTKPTPSSPATTYPHLFSNELATPATSPGGRLMPKTASDTCAYSPSYAPAATKNVHTWVTPPMGGTGITRLKGVIILNFYAAHQGTSEADEHVCMSVSRRAADGAPASVPLGATDATTECKQSIASWSGSNKIDHVSCSFNLEDSTGNTDSVDGTRNYDFGPLHRLSLSVSLANDSNAPMFLLYDHPSYASNIQVSTCLVPNGSTCDGSGS